MKQRTPEEITQIEQAIRQKYGNQAIADPSSFWTKERELEYLSQLKESIEKEGKENLQNKEGYSYVLKLFIGNKYVLCPICDGRLRKIDDVYLTKFECCEKCYILYIENGRESLWEERKKIILNNKVKNSNK